MSVIINGYTLDELKDYAMGIATGGVLTQAFTIDEYHNISVDDYVMEAFEHVSSEAIVGLIDDLYTDIIMALVKVSKVNKG